MNKSGSPERDISTISIIPNQGPSSLKLVVVCEAYDEAGQLGITLDYEPLWGWHVEYDPAKQRVLKTPLSLAGMDVIDEADWYLFDSATGEHYDTTGAHYSRDELIALLTEARQQLRLVNS